MKLTKDLQELLDAAKALDVIYGYWWDLADKPHIMMMTDGIAKFEKTHDRLDKIIRKIEKQQEKS